MDLLYTISYISLIHYNENSIMTFYDCAVPETTIRELAFRTIFQIVSALDGHPIITGIVIIARSRYTIASRRSKLFDKLEERGGKWAAVARGIMSRRRKVQ